MRTIINIVSYASLLVFASCKREFEPIEYGKDACANCKMTIVDTRYAAEMLTMKGKAYKFDDVICMKLYADYNPEQSKNAQYFVSSYTNHQSEFTDATKAVYLYSTYFASPMSGNYAAFPNANAARHLKDSLQTKTVDWGSIN